MTHGAMALLGLTLVSAGCRDDPQLSSFELPPEIPCEPSPEHTSICVAEAPRSVVAQDLDGHSGDEIVVLSASSFVTVVSGDGTAPTAVTLRTGYSPAASEDRILICDMDGDGLSELVHDGSQRFLDAAIWRQNADLTGWSHQRLGQIWLSMVHCAWSHDDEGVPELLGFASGPRVVGVLPGMDGSGVLFVETPLELPEEAIAGRFSTSLLGLDGERLLLLADPEEGVIHVVRREGDQWVAAVDVVVGGTLAVDAVVADLDADGENDIVVLTEGDVGVWVGSVASAADGYLTERFSATLGAPATQVQVADLDADGQPDLLVTDLPGTTVRWLPGLGDGSFATDQAVELGGPLMGLAPADVDGDGTVELAVLPASQDRLDIMFDIKAKFISSE